MKKLFFRFDARKLSGLIIIFVFLANVLMVGATNSNAIKIMPLGDSITKGDANGGYRQKLYLDLTDAGFDVDFVGSLSDGSGFDTDHEGHSGWYADHWEKSIRDNVYDWLEENPADIVLLHIGTNDISEGNEDVGEVEGILDEIDRYSEDITVILARIILRTDDSDMNETTKTFNIAVENMAMSRIADGDDIIIVDMENALTYPNDMVENDEHPNANGYEKMADVWYTAIYTRLVNEPILTVEHVQSWYWTDNTIINSVVEADVDGDVEIVTGGYFNDGTRDVAQLIVWDGATLSVERIMTWYWTGDTRINSVAVGNLDEDDALEIVTAGYFNDGVRDVAQLVVWDGETLAVENIKTWYWTGDTRINSVAVADVDGDGADEIVTGGYYTDGNKIAQLLVWNGTSMAVENLVAWYWTADTQINSVAIGNVDMDSGVEIVTAGYFNDGTRDSAQLVAWDGSTLAVDTLTSWYWTGDTRINSVAVGDVDGDGADEIVTGGYYTDGVKMAQLVVWNGTSMAVENLVAGYWTSETVINSVALGNVDMDAGVEIVTGGYFNDGVRDVAQLVVWDGSTLEVEPLTVWYWTGDTRINSVAIGNVDPDISEEILTAGYYDDSVNVNAQLVVWTITSN